MAAGRSEPIEALPELENSRWPRFSGEELASNLL
jgi:hypothetical protein